MMTAPVVDPTILPTSNEEQLRHEVAAATLLLNHKNIIGYSGHVSVRLPGDDTLLIQPVDHSRAELRPEQLLVCNLEGRRADETETERPPGEVFIHSEIYKARPDVRAIAHFHHDLTTTFSLVEGLHLQPIKNHRGALGKRYSGPSRPGPCQHAGFGSWHRTDARAPSWHAHPRAWPGDRGQDAARAPHRLHSFRGKRGNILPRGGIRPGHAAYRKRIGHFSALFPAQQAFGKIVELLCKTGA